MAKFKAGDLDLKTGQKIDFDDANSIHMGYDNGELYINSTISGIRAAQPYQIVRYDQLTESSGTLQDQINNIDITNYDEFIELLDTPTTYSGSTDYLVTVNSAGTDLVFSPASETPTAISIYEDGADQGPFKGLNFMGAVVSESATVSGALDIFFEDTVSSIIDGFWAEDLDESSTTSTGWIQRLRLVITPAFTDSYLVNFSTMVSHEDTGIFIKVRIQIDDSDTHKESWLELYNFKYADGGYQIWSGSFSHDFTADQTYNIDMDYATGDSGKAVYIKETSMAVQRLLTYGD